MAEIRSDGTREMIRHWASISPGPHAPLRSDVSPRAIASLLPRVFIIANDDGVWRFRLAGTEFYLLYGRELTGLSFASVWGGDHELVRRGLDDAASACLPLVVSSDAWSLEGAAAAETVLLPLRSSPEYADVDRFIGLQSFPGQRPWWLASRPFLQAAVESVALVGERERALLSEARGRNVPALRTVDKPIFFQVYENEANG
ncbi:PAS domain-containing protein [Pararhizobium sp. BT-229]|uniref:PAS domain-containing protein n=1 Tax=Pararhizobium sp. BT-229 TaxID=2986923 RepID=UPI0021F6B76E|nr:PAS domain-containing protein [Pararhizobium sp. BT-229]MCV9964685.1 PAS domain-containing protein [Pararhizobium sp. BT-229]